MTIYIYRVNAFANNLTSGNPAYVVKTNEQKSEVWMQQLALEFNQPITAFITLKKDNNYILRWFTPSQEISLCGHGTLASAHILWEENQVSKESPIYFSTKSRNLEVKYLNEGIQMAFPSDPPAPIHIPNLLQQVLSVPIKNVESNSDRYIVELENEELVKSVKPNFDLLSTLPSVGIVVTSLSSKYDFISRYFAPSIGVKEDFVTGSAHCGLAPYWNKRLEKKKFHAFQASKRGGELVIEYEDDITYITGKAYTIYKGILS
ncbi:PhzF family phenazine biosynthesis protein [Bacillus mycoides]|uniref:PhzF family phenazine biosynthesis protein n=1 Tax=Bacillus mycoides TaxID=1405 RepID=UPI001C602A5A|nr:PhzF family phenazine biosynthesis protein [Bacillus mycoides]